MSDYRFPDHIGKDPAETLPVVLDLFGICAHFWLPNELVAQGEFVRPNRATGFAYEATSVGGGTTGSREPSWPRVLGQTVVDGSVTWTCRAAGTNGISIISAPTAVSDPAGLTLANLQVIESCKFVLDYVGGMEGQFYDVVCMFTLDGKTRVARQRVPVRKR